LTGTHATSPVKVMGVKFPDNMHYTV